MLSKYLKHLSAITLLSLVTHSASANLLINPTRVQFNPADRTADVTLINTSDMTTTYRVEWAEKKAKQNGGYHSLTDMEVANAPIASKMIRFSPKQVTLKPGERQTVKLALRRPQGLAIGEYRSHLQLKALPPAKPTTNTGAAASTAINIVLNFAIPVVVQQGTLQYQFDTSGARISFNPNQKNGSVEVDLTRSGIHSVTGNINAYWTPNGGQERLIAKVGDFNFWPELQRTTVNLGWVGADFAPADGKLRIVYEGVKDFRGKIFFDKTFSINRSSIKMLN
jgi:fimbrial chaperone protein